MEAQSYHGRFLIICIFFTVPVPSTSFQTIRQAQEADIDFNPQNIPYPCCGWNGDCQNATNTFCHSECGRCTETCEGVYYKSSQTPYDSCDGLPTIPSATTPPLNPDDIPYPCCGWNGDCQNATNTFCHSECGRCTESCEGTYYKGPETPYDSCDGLPTIPPQTTAAQEPMNPDDIPYPCCGWNGDCQNATNTFCHSECGRCTNTCEGVYYKGPETRYDSCDGLPTIPPKTTAAPEPLNPDNIPYPCCGWNGDCQNATNTFCHAECGRCTESCEGVYYEGPETPFDSCEGLPTIPPEETVAPGLLNPDNIPYPCCGWNGDCQNATNTFCHAECGRCTESCGGVFYAGPQTPYDSCDGLPTLPPETVPPQPLNPDNITYPCCGWNGDCQHPDNVWCHAVCDRCVSECEGVYYSGPETGGTLCDSNGNPILPTPTPSAVPTAAPIPTSVPVVPDVDTPNPTTLAVAGLTRAPIGQPSSADSQSHRMLFSTCRGIYLVIMGLLVMH